MDPKALIYLVLIIGYLIFELYSRGKKNQQQQQDTSTSDSTPSAPPDDSSSPGFEAGPKGPERTTTEKREEPDPFDPFDQWFEEAEGRQSTSQRSQSVPLEEEENPEKRAEHQIPTYRRVDLGEESHVPETATEFPEEDWSDGKATDIPETESDLPEGLQTRPGDDEWKDFDAGLEEEEVDDRQPQQKRSKLEELLDGEFDARKAIIYSEIINPKYF